MTVTLNLSAKAVIDLTNLAVVSKTDLDPYDTGFAKVMVDALDAVGSTGQLVRDGITIELTKDQAISMLVGIGDQFYHVIQLDIVDTVRYIAEECKRQAPEVEG